MLGELFLLVTLVTTVPPDGPAPNGQVWTHEMPRNGSKPGPFHWKEIVGSTVEAEGIAWGSLEKGDGCYVILNESKIWVDDSVNFSSIKLEGKPVRIRGKLEVKEIQGSDALGRSVRWSLYYVRVSAITPIDAVTWPWLRVP